MQIKIVKLYVATWERAIKLILKDHSNEPQIIYLKNGQNHVEFQNPKSGNLSYTKWVKTNQNMAIGQSCEYNEIHTFNGYVIPDNTGENLLMKSNKYLYVIDKDGNFKPSFSYNNINYTDENGNWIGNSDLTIISVYPFEAYVKKSDGTLDCKAT